MRKIIVLAVLMAALAGCGGPAPQAGAGADAGDGIRIQHQQGETILTAQPQRVVVQDMAVLDILEALGVDAVIGVPGTGLPDYLRQYGSDPYLKTGTMQEPDYETISAARPDLVIVAGRSRTALPELSGIAPTIDLTVDNASLAEGVKQNIATLGRIFDREERAAELSADIDARFSELREHAAGAGTAMVLVTNAGRLGVYGANSRLSWIFTEAGFTPVMDEVDDRFHGGDSVSFEFILEADPDWLFVVDRDAGVAGGDSGAARALLDNALVRQTTAWQQGQVMYLDPVPAYVVMHGYTSVTRLAAQVLAAVAPEA